MTPPTGPAAPPALPGSRPGRSRPPPAGWPALRQASAKGRTETIVTWPVPPGRLRMWQDMAADAQRAAGALPTARPYTRVQRRQVPAPAMAVGFA